MGAPRAWRYFGRNLRQRFSPPLRRNIAVATRTTGEDRKAGRGLGWSALAFEEFIEIVEDLCGSGDPFFVVAVREGDAGDERGDARRLLATERIVLEVDV